MSDFPPDQIRNNDAEYMRLNRDCVERGLIHYCAGQDFGFGRILTEDGPFAVLLLAAGRRGLHWQMPPAGARELAQRLIEVADQIEAEAAQTAQALLDAALGKRPDA